MRVAPTLDRSLRIDTENPTDWFVLEMICTDASQMPDEPLANRLADYMSADEDWIDLITPELSDKFNEQVPHVSRPISTAEKSSDLTSSLFIKEDDSSLEFENLILNSAIIHYHFYTNLQSIMLEYILD